MLASFLGALTAGDKRRRCMHIVAILGRPRHGTLYSSSVDLCMRTRHGPFVHSSQGPRRCNASMPTSLNYVHMCGWCCLLCLSVHWWWLDCLCLSGLEPPEAMKEEILDGLRKGLEHVSTELNHSSAHAQ